MATCFVVQGFGKKTDFTDGRVLDLDASYAIIKDAVEAAGLECIRADEIPHSGTIDLPMYRQLLEADLVIADLSTYNVNAAFELGIRYGLRPRATIILAEEQFKNPFDVGHIVIRRYKHLGEDVGVKEAKRFGDELKQAIIDILANAETDSPVYTFLSTLEPPHEAVEKNMALAAAGSALVRAKASATVLAAPAPMAEAAPPPQSAKSALEAALGRIKAGDFAAACPLLETVRQQRPNDSFVIQQLALATYKSRQPSVEEALTAAKALLRNLSPATTNDPETLGLWGAIHKRLWELKHDPADLDEAIDACERGFHVKQDYYNGINLAHLLEQRALAALRGGQREDGLTDAMLSRRVRRQVVRYAQPLVDRVSDVEQRFWILATLREAAVGLDDDAAAAAWLAQMQTLDVAAWMRETSDSQIAAVSAARAEFARLQAGPGN